MSNNIAKTIQSINTQIEQATDCKQLAKIQTRAEKQLKKLLESIQKQLEKLKPLKTAGESISEPSADLTQLVQTTQDIINFIQITVATITEQITQLTQDIAEITNALASLSSTITQKANVLNCNISNGKVTIPINNEEIKN